MISNRLLKALILCPILLFLAIASQAQTKTITGKILDEKGNPIVGASIVVKGGKSGTTTDATGHFSLVAPAATTAVTISYIGYASQDLDVTTQSSDVSISLQPTNSNLSDIVVVGYGTAHKKDLTGAVAVVTAKNFNQGNVTNPVQQIQGKVAGLVITTPGGDPNQPPLIRLRGQTSLTGGQNPLIVVDGIALDDPNQLNNIPPSDIQTYNVLKDASATAVYGARGANGVIEITTKKGVSGQARVDYNGYVGVDVNAKKYDMLSAGQWKSALQSLGIDPGSLDKGANTDWQDAITRTAFSHNHTLAVSGGSKGFTFRASGSYLNQQGIVLSSGKEEFGLRFNATEKALNDKLNIQIGVTTTQTNRNLINYNDLTKIFNTPPTYPVYNDDGSYFYFSDFEQYNAVAHLNQEVNYAKEYLTLMYGTVDYQFFHGLTAGVTGSINNFNGQDHYFVPAFPVEATINQATDDNYNTDSRHGNIHINYLNQFGKHNIGFTGVYEYNYYTDNGMNIHGQNFLVPQNQDNNFSSAIDASQTSANTGKDEYKLISFLGRVTYNYNEKYYITASYRRDGSSKFGVNNRWGDFPSFDVAWRITQEKFMQGVSWLSELKLRAGYGVTGNSDAITPYATLLLYGPIGRFYDPANSVYPQAYAPIQNANPDLKWEERHGKNIGLDYGILNSRINGSVDYFDDKTVNLLFDYTVPVPPFFINSILANVGTLTNKGVEFSINADIVRGRKFTWNAGGQITFLKTRIESLSGTYAGYPIKTDQIGSGTAVGRGLSSYPITYLTPGYAPYVFYLPHFEGVDANGNQLFDSAGVKALTQDQNPNPTKYYIDPSPKFNYGINNTFTYGNWTLNFFMRGVVGQKIFNNTRLDFDNINRLPGNNVTKEALTNGIKDAAAVSDLWLEKASFLRMDNASLSYTFQHVKGIESLRAYVAANNVFVITPYKGLDPEIQTQDTNIGGTTNQAYIDVSYYGNAFYPKTRSFTLGVSVSF
ncbi:MAG TPA: SusC/RagA family TonB-linked outer membrane protein [Parafilimonas sp.]|nr:SusC/RagA family TonB-linked outer membrane protein [Parafilimonas sp.]